MRVLGLTVAVALVALVGAVATEAAATPRTAAGSARFDPPGGGSRVFQFSATRTTGSAAAGWATIEYLNGPRLRMTITCMRVIGKRALLAGRVRSATVRTFVGQTAVFVVEDGGAPAKDMLTLVYIADRSEKPYTCRNFPAGMVLLKPTKGAVRIGASKAETA